MAPHTPEANPFLPVHALSKHNYPAGKNEERQWQLNSHCLTSCVHVDTTANMQGSTPYRPLGFFLTFHHVGSGFKLKLSGLAATLSPAEPSCHPLPLKTFNPDTQEEVVFTSLFH